MTRRALNMVIGSVAFAGSCAALHAVLPDPEISDVTPKLRFLEQHRDDYDTIFIGSSRVHHGLMPDVFDRTMAAAGQPRHSFNLGVDGMWPPEQFYLMDLLLRIRPQKWRWVFIELNDVQVRLPPGAEQTQRAVSWHDWSRTWMIFRKLLVPDKFRAKRLLTWRGTLWLHADLLAKNLTNVGSAENLVEHFRNRDQPIAAGGLGNGADGFAPLDRRLDPAAAKAYAEKLARETPPAKPRTADRYAEAAFLDYAQQFRARGAVPIFFTSPGPLGMLPSKFAQEPAPPVLAFNNAITYPDLYRPEVRTDEGHLNTAGAQEYTRIFAERVLAIEPQK